MWPFTKARVSCAEWRPPHGTDGTPNESISDVLVRVRQVGGAHCNAAFA